MSAVDAPPRVLKGPKVRYLTADQLGRRAAEDDQARRSALDEAFRAGVAAGRATGLGAVPELVAALDRAAAATAAALRERRGEDAGSLLVLATELARWLVGRELARDPAAALSNLDRLLDELPSATGLVVHVPVELVAVVAERWAGAHGATVEGDPSLSPGEARLSTATGEARLRFDEAFAVATRALEGEER